MLEFLLSLKKFQWNENINYSETTSQNKAHKKSIFRAILFGEAFFPHSVSLKYIYIFMCMFTV